MRIGKTDVLYEGNMILSNCLLRNRRGNGHLA